MRSKRLETIQKLLFDYLDGGLEGEVGSGTGKVQNPSSTRWLSLGKCTLGFFFYLTSVLISLGRESEERGDVMATGLYHLMSKTEFIAVLLLLCHVLPTVNRLSCLFQNEAIGFPLVAISKQWTWKSPRRFNRSKSIPQLCELSNQESARIMVKSFRTLSYVWNTQMLMLTESSETLSVSLKEAC